MLLRLGRPLAAFHRRRAWGRTWRPFATLA
jgi:hypothetical protein